MSEEIGTNAYSEADPQKLSILEQEVNWRERRRKEHNLRELLIELTDACNLACLHCGSSCLPEGTYISADKVFSLIDELAEAYTPGDIRITFTGGEPLLHPSFIAIARHAISQGFQTGLTTNGTLITKHKAQELTQMRFGVVTVSLDGLRKSHDTFRNSPGSWEGALRGIDNLLDAGIIPSITTVANPLNIDELDDMLLLLQQRGIRHWRILSVDPIGRAMRHPELLLNEKDSGKMWWFIENRRSNHANETPSVTASCSHYLGPLLELETRDWPFSCRSGTSIASVTAKGEYVGCLDVERKDFLVMGHLGEDSFVKAWEEDYKPYRNSRVPLCETCSTCEHSRYCDGDSMHTWDFNANAPRICIGMRKTVEQLAEQPDPDATDPDATDTRDHLMYNAHSTVPENISKLENADCQHDFEMKKTNNTESLSCAIAKIAAMDKHAETINSREVVPRMDKLLNQTFKPSNNSKQLVAENKEEIDKKHGFGKLDYMEQHRDDEDAKELYETAKTFTRAGLRAGIITGLLISGIIWIVARSLRH